MAKNFHSSFVRKDCQPRFLANSVQCVLLLHAHDGGRVCCFELMRPRNSARCHPGAGACITD